ncbi:hypothetical protein T492DRAFT_558894, partial [Pavlovales sp. CCMP2436]
ARVPLGAAGNFVVLTKSGITNVPPSVVGGDIGSSPIDHASITGFALNTDASGTFATSEQVSCFPIYTANHAAPTPSKVTTAVL